MSPSPVGGILKAFETENPETALAAVLEAWTARLTSFAEAVGLAESRLEGFEATTEQTRERLALLNLSAAEAAQALQASSASIATSAAGAEAALETMTENLLETSQGLDALSRQLVDSMALLGEGVNNFVDQLGDLGVNWEGHEAGGLLDFLGFIDFGGIFHSGGQVDLPQEESLILVERGEGVLNRQAMDRLGREGLEALNRGELPASINITIHANDRADWGRLIERRLLPALERTRFF